MAPDIIFCHDAEEFYQRKHELKSEGWRRDQFDAEQTFFPANFEDAVIATTTFERQTRGPLGRFRANEYTVIVWLDR